MQTMKTTARQKRAFWLGVYSVFTLGRVRIFGNAGNKTSSNSAKELKRIRPFANDMDALRSDAEKVGHDFQNAIMTHERDRTR